MKLESNTIKNAAENAGGSEELLYEMLNKFRLWLQQQMHLPQEVSDKQLQKTILTSKFNMEKAKKRLDSLYTLRSLIPEIFDDYDPLSDGIIEHHKNVQWVILPKLTLDKNRVTCFRFLKRDASTFSPPDLLKYYFMALDVCTDEEIHNSEIMIWDCNNFTFNHMLKYTPSILKKIDLVSEAYGQRFQAIYLINAPSYIEQFMKLIRMMMKPKLYERIQVFETGIESTYEFIPKSILPVDYGGEEPSLNILSAMWNKKLLERRNWLLEQEKLRTNESLRTDCVIDPDTLFGVAGTFRKLDID